MDKTKYVQVVRAVPNNEHLCCGQHKFERVKEFSYLGSQMNHTNSISSEIQARIGMEINEIKSIKQKLKVKNTQILLRPVVTYGCDAWTSTNQDEQFLGIFECRILRKISVP